VGYGKLDLSAKMGNISETEQDKTPL